MGDSTNAFETRNSEIRRQIQQRYFFINWKIAKLSTGRNSNDTNIKLKRDIVELVNLASFNKKFPDLIKEKYEPYYFRIPNRYSNPKEEIKKTLEIWQVITAALVETKIIILDGE